MLWLLYVCRHNTQNPPNRRLCRPLSLFGSFGGEKNLMPLQGTEAETVQSTSYLLYWLCYHSFSVLLYKFLLLMCQHPCHFCIRNNKNCWTMVRISKQSSVIPYSLIVLCMVVTMTLLYVHYSLPYCRVCHGSSICYLSHFPL